MNKMITGAFVGSLAVVTWRELKNPPAGAPLPIPVPSAYVGTAIVYGILGFVGDTLNEKIANWLAAAYFLVLLIHTAQNSSTASGPSSQNYATSTSNVPPNSGPQSV